MTAAIERQLEPARPGRPSWRTPAGQHPGQCNESSHAEQGEEHADKPADLILGTRRGFIDLLGTVGQQGARQAGDDEHVTTAEGHTQGQADPRERLGDQVVAQDHGDAGQEVSQVGVDGRVVLLVHLAEPFGQQAVQRHGNHDAGHADVAVADDLEAVEQVAEADDQHHQRAGGEGHGQDRRPQIEAVDVGLGDQRPVACAGHVQEFRAGDAFWMPTASSASSRPVTIREPTMMKAWTGSCGHP